MSTPLILSDQGDIAVFETVRDLERYVESPDVAAYRVYDATGRRYFFKGYRNPSRDSAVFQKVELVELDEENPGPDESDDLMELLRSYLRRVERRDSGDTLSLQQLVQKTVELSGYTR